MQYDIEREQRTKLEMIPDAGIPALQKAFDRVKGKRATILKIWQDTNELLAESGLPATSQSGFYRWVAGIKFGRIKRPALDGDQTPPAVPLDLVRACLATMPGTASSIAAALRTMADEIERAASKPLQKN
ncbi:hypothetical protein [Mesorhizobium sp. M0898]|uniref:hypothetical protein n=1 Tax=Mesorhizobium sp. M0898 TaxID=2957020 RepID=UPI0033385EA1